VRKILWLVFGLWLGGRLLSAGAETYGLTDGTSLTGDVVRYDDNGVLVRTPDDVYTNLTWTRFSQDGLKVLAQNPKLTPFVEPFIIPPPVARAQKEEIKIQPVSRLEPPPKASLIGAMFSSPVGLVVMLVIYAANLFVALEVSIFRSRPVGLVMGVAAVLPILGPIIFVSLPGQAEPRAAPEQEVEAAPGAAARAGGAPASAPTPSASAPAAAGTSGEAAAPHSGIHLTSASWQSAEREPAAEREPPAAQVFQRGQFMFNRRFFETKFTGFFGLIRREADKHLVLLVKTPRGQFDVQRITRIAANDVHFEILEGAARKEVMVPFAEIQEVQLKPKDA
jgi:hypothetical protein